MPPPILNQNRHRHPSPADLSQSSAVVLVGESVGAGRVQRSADRSNDALSRRQDQTLQHLLEGDNEKQVARKLSLSRHTVHVYVKALYRRYGVSSRAELLA